MTLSQSLIALTVVTVTMLVLWYIDKEIKILKMDINSTHNMLYNIKSEMNNSSYTPIHDNVIPYEIDNNTTCIDDQRALNQDNPASDISPLSNYSNNATCDISTTPVDNDIISTTPVDNVNCDVSTTSVDNVNGDVSTTSVDNVNGDVSTISVDNVNGDVSTISVDNVNGDVSVNSDMYNKDVTDNVVVKKRVYQRKKKV